MTQGWEELLLSPVGLWGSHRCGELAHTGKACRMHWKRRGLERICGSLLSSSPQLNQAFQKPRDTFLPLNPDPPQKRTPSTWCSRRNVGLEIRRPGPIPTPLLSFLWAAPRTPLRVTLHICGIRQLA